MDNHTLAAGQPEAEATVSDETLSQLGQVLDVLGSSPYDYAKHQEHLELAKQLGPDALYEARELFARFFPLTSDQWMEWIKESQAQPATPENVHKTVTLFQKSLQDILSVDLCHAYALYALQGCFHSRGMTLFNSEAQGEEATEEPREEDGVAHMKDQELERVWSLSFTRTQLEIASNRATQNIILGHTVWNLLRDFELYCLKEEANPERQMATQSVMLYQEQFERVRSLYLSRLSQPHKHMEDTFSSFSSFISSWDKPENYEDQLVAANTVYSSAKALWDFRETKELELAAAGYSAAAYIHYATWERTGKKAAQLNPMHARNIYERAVERHRSDYSVWEAYQDFWRDLIGLEESEGNELSEEEMTAGLLDVAERSARHVPFVGDSWAALMRAQERAQLFDAVELTFRRAVDSKLFASNVDSVVKVYMARADFQRRLFETILESEQEPPPFLVEVKQVITEGTKAVKRASKAGDPQMRLEHYLTRFCERFGQLDEAESVWKNAVSMYKGNHMAWLGYVDLQLKRNDLDGARDVFERAGKCRFDYPEYIFEAHIAFEHQNGDLDEFEQVERRIRKQMKGVTANRMRMAAEAEATQAEQPADQGLVEGSRASKRPAEDDAGEGQAKRARREPSAQPDGQEDTAMAPPPPSAATSTEPPKRDRDNSTVIVCGLPLTADQAELDKMFRDCGDIRETGIFPRDGQTFATVEFKSKDSVPAALTKDKKRIHGHELTVEFVWQATVYVTNFPESIDDARMKELFSPYGIILDVRWPSKRFKSTRRFCYVQFANAASAQRSLELHEKEFEGLKMSVLISDPQRKKERTDVTNNQKEIYVAGLARSVTDEDVRKLFAPYGSLKGVRVMKDDSGQHCRGFAFVDFENEASARASLALNSTEFKKRHLSVTIADSRQAGTKARSKQIESTPQSREQAKAKSIRVSNLPPQTQDGVLQQFFTRHGKVSKTIVHADKGTATVEFDSDSTVGRLLLMPEGSVEFEGTKLKIEPMAKGAAPQGAPVASGSDSATPENQTQDKSSARPAASEGMMMAPRIVRGRGRGRGGRGRGGFARS